MSPEANAGVTETTVSPTQLPEDFDPMAAAVEADNATETPAQPEQKPQQKPQSDKPSESASAKATADKQGADPTKKDAKPGEQGKPETETPASKEQKETERRDRSWKALDAEKQAFRAEKAQLLNQMQAMQRELAQLKQQRAAEPVKDGDGISADVYDRLEKKLRSEGDDEGADLARKRADNLRRQESAARTSQPANQQPAHTTPEFQAEWQRHTAELIADEPDLGNADNPVVKAANALLQDKQWSQFFLSRPDGIRAAVEVAKILQQNAGLAATREELKTAKAEIERLTKLTQPRGSHPTSQPNNTQKAVTEMTDEDVMAAAHAADTGG